MSNHVASFETIIESVDALSPAELDALQARISRSRLKQVPATKRTSERSVFEIPYDEYLAFSDEERDALQWRVYHEHHNWSEAELKARRVQWMIVCGGEIVEFSRTLDNFPTPEKLQVLGKERGFIPFVFVPKPLIEESTWSALDEDDFYPTLTFSVAGKDQEESTTVSADLDTGSPHLFVDCLVNPNRQALAGRNVLLKFPVKVELDGEKKTTRVLGKMAKAKKRK